ncbi:dihydrolipoyllysine-residue acetyltransferase component of pyruvate dehydrogenase complex-like [Rhopilema esculentum]|uniref:dihydrolipoyllysine-residue acetyltransferase component of pyruvate dehydrogenase complex-like n=1 Tax=Rhopilema esculentum TaxID=499914 RepID=UPI0031E34514
MHTVKRASAAATLVTRAATRVACNTRRVRYQNRLPNYSVRLLTSQTGKTVHFSSRNAVPAKRLAFLRISQPARPYSDEGLPSHEKVILPNLSPTMESGTIVSWEKEEGQRLNEGDVLAMIETDKATMEMETPEEGYLAKILVPGGTKDVPVKEIICIIVEEEADIAAFKDYTLPASAAPVEAAPKKEEPVPEAPKVEPPPSKAPEPSPAKDAKSAPVKTDGRIMVSPLAKKLAAEKGLDLSLISGSGPGGRITVSDVENATAKAAPAPAAARSQIPVQPPPRVTVTEGKYADMDLSSMRKTIAKRLLEAKQTIPHYYLSIDVNMDNVLKLRQDLNGLAKDSYKLSVNDFIIKASSLALKKVPDCNSSWMGEFIRRYYNVDVSVAVSTDNGLITPIVFDADKKGLVDINTDVRTLAEKARNKLLQPNEFVGGTFTISNLGMYGVKNFSAVINPPQSCILAVGTTEKALIPDESDEKGYKVANMMSVTLSCDHRVVDGAVGAQWLQHFKSYLEKPSTMLL